MSWLLAIGCNDDDDRMAQPGDAGGAGVAPGGGKSGGGTSSGGASSGGNAGNAGSATAGKGGASGGGGAAPSAGGTSGSMNDAGHAGTPETPAGGAGGATETSGGAGGAAAGQSGAGGEGAVPATVAPHCAFSCASDNDCLVDDDDTIKCNLTLHRCEDPADACTADEDCLVSLSAWSRSCTSDTGCLANAPACVQVSGQGFCAKLPGAGAPACASPTVPKQVSRFGAAGTVQVCASADPRCFGGRCRKGCGDTAAGCGLGKGDTCSAVTGLCECTNGSECTKTGICGRDRHCQACKIDADCAASAPDTACLEGKCGCPNAEACASLDPGYASAAPVCQ